ncbi:MAG: polyprenyl synthetase family protein [Deltaproteobacteria bacterium]
MDLEKYFAEKSALVNKELKRLVPGEHEYPESLHRAMHYSLFAGGKRIRPALALASSEAIGKGIERALNAACAIECVHSYSLIHDDLPALDNDDMRRGRPSCHKAFGEATAILAGDALLTAAFEMLGRSNAPASLVVKAVQELGRAAGSLGMVGGQAVDLESEGKEIPFPTLEYIHIHKTGRLILASVRCGAILSGANEGELKALTAYGEAAGLAFQIADDILDVEGLSSETGKNAGGDKLKGKATYPGLVGISEAKKRASELAQRAVDALSGFDQKAGPLRDIAIYIVSRRK